MTPVPADIHTVLWERRVSGAQYLHACAVVEDMPPRLQDALVARYADIAGPVRQFYVDGGRVLDTWNDAGADLRHVGAELARTRPGVAFDDDAVERAASSAARYCMHETSQESALAFAAERGVRIPHGPRVTSHGLWRRLRSSDWWRRQLRASLTRQCEALFRQLGFIRNQQSPYLSQDALQRVRAAGVKARHWMRETTAVCEDTGEAIPLEHIAEHSLANPAIRRGELMTRARGCQETAEACGHRCLMVTMTAPSAFHAWLHDGSRNPRYNGTTPRDAQRWLTQHWARARAALASRHILVYGFRVAEPHHDGTPHWHAVLYVPAADEDTLRAQLTRVWLTDHTDEPGAAEHRIRFTCEDPARGSGVGYLSKYIAKGIDGAGRVGAEASDETGRPVADDVERVVAWSRLWGIRQFQSVGGPAVGVWRELRRVREPCDCPPLEALRLTTDHSEHGGPSWARFIAELGGIGAALKQSRALLDKAEPRKLDSAGRCVLRLTRWDEMPGLMVVGLRVEWNGRIKRLATRPHVWVLVFVPVSLIRLGPVVVTVAAGSPDTWTNPNETSRAGPGAHAQGALTTCKCCANSGDG